jgi:succinyl-diaminopimelate desuccinylase
MNTSDPASILQQLIACPSITPADGGALDAISAIATELGFECHRKTFSEHGTADIDNLYARFGQGGRHLLFAGHSDVVPPGDISGWRHPPFAAAVENGKLYGRGAVDMKGGIACFLAATARYVARHGAPDGSVSLLITGDEEGPSVNGTDKLLKWASAEGEKWDAAIVGEPTNPARIGDMIKIGRRGSLSGKVAVTGVQGHSAYPHLADNPVNGLLDLVESLLLPPFDEGSDNFQPSNIEVTSLDVGNETTNVIAAQASARFNFRFNDLWNEDSAKREILRRLGEGSGSGRLRRGRAGPVRFNVEWIGRVSPVFLTRDERLIDTLRQAVATVTGLTAELSTSGGTSDARFIKDYCPVVEFGLVGQTMHQVDEHVVLGDLETLTGIYLRFLKNWFDP